MKSTTDLWFATFLTQSGVTLSGYDKLGPRKAKFKFKISDEEWAAKKLEYFHSDLNKFRQAQERLKDLSY